MKLRLVFLFLIALLAINTHAQQNGESRIGLTSQAIAHDSDGRDAIAARLRTTDLNGSADSPIMNISVVLENRSPFFYEYVSGWVTFYNSEGIRCGEGLFKLDALAAGEAAETDTPGLRLRCSPTTWRVVATNLLTRTGNAAKTSQPVPDSPASPGTLAMPLLQINIDGETLPLQLGNPIEINTSQKQSVHIVVSARQ